MARHGKPPRRRAAAVRTADGSAAGPGRSLAARLVDRFRPLPRVNHVAFGTFCHVASSLRAAGLRRWTGPLDWIFSAPGLIAEGLDDGFAAFLAPEHLRSVPAAERTHGAKRQCRHLAYEARYGLPILFNHHDPAGSATDRQALGRAVRRMRRVLEPGHANLFYMMSEVAWPADDVAALARRLGAGPARNALVVITARGGEPERSWSQSVGPGSGPGCPVLAVDLRTRSRSNGVLFPDPEDEAFFQDALRALAAGFEAGLSAP